MVEVRLERSIISFDGRVIEAFSDSLEAKRYHVAHVKTIDIPADKKGRQALRILMKGHGGIMTGELSPEAIQQAQQLVAEVEKIRASL
jgi:hypothetical protein